MSVDTEVGEAWAGTLDWTPICETMDEKKQKFCASVYSSIKWVIAGVAHSYLENINLLDQGLTQKIY